MFACVILSVCQSAVRVLTVDLVFDIFFSLLSLLFAFCVSSQHTVLRFLLRRGASLSVDQYMNNRIASAIFFAIGSCHSTCAAAQCLLCCVNKSAFSPSLSLLSSSLSSSLVTKSAKCQLFCVNQLTISPPICSPFAPADQHTHSQNASAVLHAIGPFHSLKDRSQWEGGLEMTSVQDLDAGAGL